MKGLTVIKVLKGFLFVILFIIAIKICINFSLIKNEIDFSKYDSVLNIYFSFGNTNNTDLYNWTINKGINKQMYVANDKKWWFGINEGVANLEYGDNELAIVSFDKLNIEDINDYEICNVAYIKENNELYFNISNAYHYYICNYNVDNNNLIVIAEFEPFDYQQSFGHNWYICNKKIYAKINKNEIFVYDITTHQNTSIELSVRMFAVNEQENLLVCVDYDNNLFIYDLNTNIIIDTKKFDNIIDGIDIDRDGDFVLVVENSKENSWVGHAIHCPYKMNELNLYEISTWNCKTIKTRSMFGIVFNCRFDADN